MLGDDSTGIGGDVMSVFNQQLDYLDAMQTIAANLPATVAAQNAPGESWLDTIQRILPSIAATWQQKELMQVQIDRAKQGLAPLDMSAYSGLGVNVGLSASTQKMLLLLGGGLALAFVAKELLARR